MGIQKTLCFLILGISMAACNSGNPLHIPEIPADFLKGDTKLSSEFFFIGPEIDSVNAEVVAECDCCASDLTLLNDTSFIYTSICLGGDSYLKGNYLVFGDLLILHTDEEVISSEYAVGSEGDSPASYKVIQQKRAHHVYKISTLKGKQVIVYSSKDDYTEYGMPTHGSLRALLEEFRKEKVLRRFLEAE